MNAPAVTDSHAKINLAVLECLHHCYAQPSPLSAVVAYLDHLRAQPGWSEIELQNVQRIVLRMLRAMLENEDSPAA